MSLGSIIIDLLMKTGSFETDTKRAENSLKRLKKTAQDSGKGIRDSFAGNLLADLSQQIGRALVNVPREILRGVDALNDLRDATGASIETLSALEDVGARTGTSFDGMASSLVKFNKALSDVDGKNEVSQVFKALSLDAEALKRADPAESLRQTAVALSRFATDGEKARAIQVLFGKSIRESAPFLDELAKQTKLVGTVTTEQAQAVEKFNQQISSLQKNVLDAARAFTTDLIPALNSFFKNLNDAGGISGSIAMRLGLNESGVLTTKLNTLNQRINVVGDSIVRMNTEFERSGKKDSLLSERIDHARLKLAALQREAAGVSDALKGVADKLAPREPGFLGRSRVEGVAPLPTLQVPPVPKSITGSKAIGEAQRYIEALQKQVDKTRDLSAAEQTLLDIRRGLTGLTPAGEKRIKELAALIDSAKALKDEQQARESVVAWVQRQQDALESETEAIINGNARLREEIALIGAEGEARAAIIKAQQQALITEKEAALAAELAASAENARTRALREQVVVLRERQLLTTQKGDQENFERVKDEIKKLDESFKSSTTQMSEFALEASRNIQDALGDTLFRSLKGDFQSIGQLWSDLILRMIAQAAAAKLNKALFGDDLVSGLVGAQLNLALSGGQPKTSTTGDFAREDRALADLTRSLDLTTEQALSLIRATKPTTDVMGALAAQTSLAGEALSLIPIIIRSFGESASSGISSAFGAILNTVIGSFGSTATPTTGDFARLDRALPQSLSKTADGGVSIVQNIAVGSNVSRNDVVNAMVAAKEQAKAEIIQLQRSGQFANV